jgi:hypothetical protein
MQAESHTAMFNEIFVIMESFRIDFPVGFVDSHVSLHGEKQGYYLTNRNSCA